MTVPAGLATGPYHVLAAGLSGTFDVLPNAFQVVSECTSIRRVRVEVLPQERGKHGVKTAVFRFLGVEVTNPCNPILSVGPVSLNGEGVQVGDFLWLKLEEEKSKEKEARVKESDGVFRLRMKAPQFIFSAMAEDASGNVVSIQAAILLEDFAGAELALNEVVPGTENQRGVPVDAEAAEEFAELLADLLEQGFVNPPGLPSAIITE